MTNVQYGNVGDLGDIAKHGALVELAVMMGGLASGPVSYVETNTFVLRAPIANDKWQEEVTAELDAWPGYRRYFERELPEVAEGNYRCSCGLALDFLPEATLYLAEYDPQTQAILREQLAAERATPAYLVAEAQRFAGIEFAGEPGPLLILVDPFDEPEAYWTAVNHLTSSLCGPQEAGVIEVFQYKDYTVEWPKPPVGFLGPVATIERAPSQLAVYATAVAADEVRSSLRRLGWSTRMVS